MSVILITGASGMTGGALIPALQKQGHSVKTLSTQKQKPIGTKNVFFWDIKNKMIEEGALDNVDVIIHLAGANVGKKRWTGLYKKEIIKSRVESANLLYKTCMDSGTKITCFISSSGIGFYNDPYNDILTENDKNGTHFLAGVCAEWEKSALQFNQLDARVVILRTGPVLSKNNGLLKAFSMAKWLRIIPTTGSPQNTLSWICIDDLVDLYLDAVTNTNIQGIYNAVSPNPSAQIEIARGIARANKIKCFYPNVPSWALRIALGEQADIAVSNQNVSAEKILQTGFKFRFPTLDSALNHLIHEQ